jgi:hypothetical protein
MNKIILAIVIGVLLVSSAFAQVDDSTRTAASDTTRSPYRGIDETVIKPKPEKSPAQITGEVGLYGELYSVSGRDKRRPSSSARIFLRPTLTLFGALKTSVDIIYSSEGNSSRQHINQFGLHPSWSWGKAHVGDFNQPFSEYTLNNISIRGAGVDINPGLLRFQAVSGQTKRTVKADADNSVYSQYAYGAKIGVGREDGSFFDINVLRVKDDKNSLPDEIFQYVDSSGTHIEAGVTPQENLVAGANTVLKFLDKSLVFKGEIAGSGYTRNLYSSRDVGDDVPQIVEDIFPPRISSYFDYAFSTALAYNHRIFNVKSGYSYIGPGYTSLGLGSNLNDRQTIDGGFGARFLRNRVSLQTTLQVQNDNVNDQKTSTTTRTTYSITLNTRPTNQLSLMFNVVNNIMKNDNADSTYIYQDSVIFESPDTVITQTDSTLYLGEIHNVNSSYSANAMYQFLIANRNQNINVNYSIQTARDKNPMRSNNDSNTQNIMLSYMSMLNQIWAATVSFNYNIIDIESLDKTDRTTLGLQVSNRVLRGKLANSLGTNYSFSDEANVIALTLSSRYSLTAKDSIRLIVKSSFYRGNEAGVEDYDEFISSLGFTHRF